MTAHSGYTVEDHSISRVQPLGCITIKRGPPGWIEATASQEACGAFGGMMNKDTKEPAEKVLLCRKSATPTVAGFGEEKTK